MKTYLITVFNHEKTYYSYEYEFKSKAEARIFAHGVYVGYIMNQTEPDRADRFKVELTKNSKGETV